jgi:hypothetical protein
MEQRSRTIDKKGYIEGLIDMKDGERSKHERKVYIWLKDCNTGTNQRLPIWS